jgi:hypothetical protein
MRASRLLLPPEQPPAAPPEQNFVAGKVERVEVLTQVNHGAHFYSLLHSGLLVALTL